MGADKAYGNRRTRTHLRERGIRHVIPEKRDQAAGRLRRGCRGGRPPGLDKGRYKKRNTVERAINKLKQFRAVATRYDKRGYVFLGTVTAAALLIWLRSWPEAYPTATLTVPRGPRAGTGRPKRVATMHMIGLGACS